MKTYFDGNAKDQDADSEKVECARAVADDIRESVSLNTGPSAFKNGCGTGLLSFDRRSHRSFALGRQNSVPRGMPHLGGDLPKAY